MKPSLVSIIIPTCNRMHMLDLAIRSAISQTVRDWELIIVDDASIDDTFSLVKGWTDKDKRISYFRNQSSLGGAEARNIGVFKAQGKYIAFLDDDDVWLPHKIEKQTAILEQNPCAVASTCWFRANYLWGKRVIKPVNKPCLQELLSANILGSTSLCMVRRPVFEKVGGFSKNLPSSQDWDFWVKLLREGSVISVPEVLVEYSVHNNIRISADLNKKYIGFRRFYLKYRALMSARTRKAVLSLVAYINSRRTRLMRAKFKWLYKSLKWNKYLSRKMGYILSFLFHFFR